MKLDLKFFPDPVLSAKCEKVTDFSKDCLILIDQMKEALYSLPGLALAAPQVGVLGRIVILNMMKIQAKPEMLVLVNPIIKTSEGEVALEEGCLSIPEIFEEITRPKRVEVAGMDAGGVEFVMEADDILARVIQHEIDHLDGLLFWDHLPEKKKNKLKKKYQKNRPETKTDLERKPKSIKNFSSRSFSGSAPRQ